jgi:hypothetical protein
MNEAFGKGILLLIISFLTNPFAMNRALTLIFTLLALSLSGQSFTPFASAGTRWNEVCYSPLGEPSSPAHRLDGYQLAIDGDTLVDGQTYLRITYRPTWFRTVNFVTQNMETVEVINEGNLSVGPVLIGGLRQDTLARKVYFINLAPWDWQSFLKVTTPPAEEILLYDFSLQPGEMVDLPDQTTTVTSIFTTPLPDGSVRLAYQFAGSDRLWIEGVGGSLGLLDPLRGEFLESGCALRCVYQDTSLLVSFDQLPFPVPPLTDD